LRVRWRKQAAEDLEEAAEYIAADNPTAAAHVALAVLRRTRELAQTPWIGRSGRVPDTREFVIPNTPLIAAYTVVGSTAWVLRVIHSARKWPDRF
jgi:toxin ParE1/3/4